MPPPQAPWVTSTARSASFFFSFSGCPPLFTLHVNSGELLHCSLGWTWKTQSKKI
jgi:hypothetical protein